MPEPEGEIRQQEALAAVVYLERDVDGRRKTVSFSIAHGSCPTCRRPILTSRALGFAPLPIDSIRVDDLGRLTLDAHRCPASTRNGG